MKAALVFVALLVGVVLAEEEEKYTTKYDNVELDQILNNDRLLSKYIQCLKDEVDNGCTPDGKELKKSLPEALSNECAKCSEKQKEGTKKVIKFLVDNKKADWEELKKKYDPEGSYSKKYEDKLKGL